MFRSLEDYTQSLFQQNWDQMPVAPNESVERSPSMNEPAAQMAPVDSVAPVAPVAPVVSEGSEAPKPSEGAPTETDDFDWDLDDWEEAETSEPSDAGSDTEVFAEDRAWNQAEDATVLDEESVDSLWDLFVNALSEVSETIPRTDDSRLADRTADQKAQGTAQGTAQAKASEPGSEPQKVAELEQTVQALAEWQRAVQTYLRLNAESEEMYQVVRELAAHGVVLNEQQIQEVVQKATQAGLPPSVYLKATAFEWLSRQKGNNSEVPFPFLSQQAPSNPLLPTRVPYSEYERPQERTTGFIGLDEFERRLGLR